MVQLNRGFNLVKIDDIENNNLVLCFSCDIKSDLRLDFQLIALNELGECVSENTTRTPQTWYNEVADTSNCSINYVCKNTSVFLSCHSPKKAIIDISNINKCEIDQDKKINSFFNFKQFRMKNEFPTWKELVLDEINLDNGNGFDYPLIENTYDKEEIIRMMEVLTTNRLTMGENVDLFEKEFAKYVGANYAIMVNSGSSANLLSMAVATNYKRKNKLNAGDKVIVPNICWSTSVWPIIQMNLQPVFVDIDPTTMNMNIDELEKLITPDVKGIVAVHILGNCTNMDRLMKIVEDNNLFIMEDTCESLGSLYKNKMLGTFGDFGTYSFYYSHHITTVEGGMVVCNDEDDYELLKCLRAHGWTRYLKDKKELEEQYKEVDPRFLFVNVGYNFRPMETQAAMGRIQLAKLNKKNNSRIYNHDMLVDKILRDTRNTNIFTSPVAMENSNPAWFALTFVLSENYEHHYRSFMDHLTVNKVENRPVITGNFARQPIFKFMDIEIEPTSYEGAEILHKRGFFIGLSCADMLEERMNNLVNIFYSYNFN
jgi:CDP-4-dehydro-6-deoxyglucose reductase, E1